jgi:hypothetical protein
MARPGALGEYCQRRERPVGQALGCVKTPGAHHLRPMMSHVPPPEFFAFLQLVFFRLPCERGERTGLLDVANVVSCARPVGP